jgi:heat shock protein HslJ
MTRHRLTGLILGLLLSVALPGVAVAQEAETTSPEGVRWDLTQYAVDGTLTDVPWDVDATLLMEDGTASGSGGCNTFSTGYTLEADVLTFQPEMASTRMACPDEQMAVEDAYLEALPTVANWVITEEGSLEFSANEGQVVLAFEQPSVGLTRSDLAALTATFEALTAEIDELRASADKEKEITAKLRERIRTLEAAEAAAKEAAEEAAKKKATTFSAAEKVLLEGIPADIRATCSPRRSANPAGTVAAVQCKPNAAVVRDMAYYLMDGDDADAVFMERVNQAGKLGSKRCSKGKPAVTYWVGGGPTAELCYRNDDGRANLRFERLATACKQLKVDGKTLKTPTFYVAVLGHDGNIKKLADWATNDGKASPSVLTKTIKRPNAPAGEGCPHG